MNDKTISRTLKLQHGELNLPVYLPDATFGVVRAVDAADLENCGVEAVVMNTFHLMQKPGSSTVQALGGVHRMSGWKRPIFTDSGGFQAYSLIHQNASFGHISERGLTFRPESADRDFQLTPEKSVQLQMAYGSDVVICLDDCTHVDAPDEEQRISVERTIAWAQRSKAEFLKLAKQKRLSEDTRPLLFGVIQGGGNLELRRTCAEALLNIGFDGFGYGGWPLDSNGKLLSEVLAFLRAIVPRQFPMHALGIGHPENVAICYRLGYDLFDCAMPTRDARHGRLYTFTRPPNQPGALAQKGWLAYLYIKDERHIKTSAPISPYCDCPVCSRYSLGYLRHLYKMNDSLYLRLATLHNLRFMTSLTAALRRDADLLPATESF